jgi:hypothetical protein
MQDLMSRVKAAVSAVADAKSEMAYLQTVKAPSASAALSSLAIAAFKADEHTKIRDGLKTSEAWKKAASTWSGAIGLAKYLADGSTLPQGDREEPFTIGGQAVTIVTAAHIQALAEPAEGDTTIPALVKHAKSIKSARRTVVAEAEATVSATVDAYLASPEGKARYEGETLDTLLPYLLVNPAEYARVMDAGAAALGAEAAALTLLQASQNDEAFASSVLDFIAAAGPNVLDLFAMAIEERRTALTPAPAEAVAA